MLRTRFCLLLLLSSPIIVRAQSGSSTDILRGRVIGPRGEPVAGARLEAVSVETGVRRTSQTNTEGRFTLTFPEGGGRFRLQVTAPNYAPTLVNVAREADEDVLIVNVRLQPQAVQLEAIRVQAQRTPPPGSGNSGSTERALSGELANRLPLESNDPAALAQLTPGVVGAASGDSLGDRGGFSVAGQRASLNGVTLDGAQFGSALSGGQFGGGNPLGVPQEAVRSTQVVTSTYDVARGQFAGGLVATTTRSGTNVLHGSMQFQLRDDLLQGGSTRNEWNEGFSQGRFSGGIGGPLVRHRLFYNVSVSAQRRQDALRALLPRDPAGLLSIGADPDSVSRFLQILQSRYGIDPSGLVGAYDRVGDAWSGLARVDYVINQQNTLAIRGFANASDQDSTRISFLELKQNGGEVNTWGAGAVVTLSSQFRGGWINELRASHTLDRRELEASTELPEGRVRIGSSLTGGTRSIATVAFGGDRAFPSDSREQTTELANELSLLVGDQHRLKLGLLGNWTAFDQRTTNNQLGTFEFSSLSDFELGRPSRYTRTLASAATHGDGWSAAGYLGDTWRPRQGLQLTLGVRLEHSGYGEAPPRNARVEERFGRRTDQLPEDLGLSPRVGFSWRLSEQGAPVRLLRGGFGEFRGRTPFSLYASVLEGAGAGGESQLICVGTQAPTPDFVSTAIPESCRGGGTGPLPTTRARSISTFDNDFEAPRSWRASLGLQGQLIRLLSGSVDVSYARGVSLYGVRDLNLRDTAAFHLARENNRPVFVPLTGIDTARGEMSLFRSRRFPEFAQVWDLHSELKSETGLVTLSLNGLVPLFALGEQTERGRRRLLRRLGPQAISFQGSYTLAHTRDQSSWTFGGPQVGFNFTPVRGEANRVEWGPSDQDRRHTFTAIVGAQFTPAFELSLVGRTSSGAPFTPIVGGDINGDGARNDAAFVFDPTTSSGEPTLLAGIADLLEHAPEGAAECLRSQLGAIARRGSCRGDWTGSLDLRGTVRPELGGRFGRRFSVALDAFNLAAGLDLLLNGSDNIRGWGQGGRGQDNVLLYPRGFDPSRGEFRYQVNGRFGQSRLERFAAGSPFGLQLTTRMLVGPQNNGGAGSLAGIAFGRGGFGGGGFGGGRGGPFGVGPGGPGGGGGPGAGFDPGDILERLLPNPVSAIVALRDTLRLTAEQVQRLAAISDSLDARNDTLREQITAWFRESAGRQGGNPGEAFGRIAPQLTAGRRNVQTALTEARAVLTPEQWRRVPAAVRNSVSQTGPAGGGRRGTEGQRGTRPDAERRSPTSPGRPAAPPPPASGSAPPRPPTS